MKKININKEKWELIKERHFNYCKTLKLSDGTRIDEDVCRKLCCEDPFDFTISDNTNPKYKFFKQEYWDYIEEGYKYDYSQQYKNFRIRSRGGWSGVTLIQELGINVCPYCGINYFSTIKKNKNNKVVSVATFDHYRPQKIYPMFAMNLYNLIPSCKNCNSTFKLDSEEIICSPYFCNLEEKITFRIKNKDVIEQILSGKSELEILLDYDYTNTQLRNHDRILCLTERYNYYKNIAKSLIYKKRIYNDSYLKQLSEMGLNLTKKHIEDLIIKQDIFCENEPFLKFKQDIWLQLK